MQCQDQPDPGFGKALCLEYAQLHIVQFHLGLDAVSDDDLHDQKQQSHKRQHDPQHHPLHQPRIVHTLGMGQGADSEIRQLGFPIQLPQKYLVGQIAVRLFVDTQHAACNVLLRIRLLILQRLSTVCFQILIADKQ